MFWPLHLHTGWKKETRNTFQYNVVQYNTITYCSLKNYPRVDLASLTHCLYLTSKRLRKMGFVVLDWVELNYIVHM